MRRIVLARSVLSPILLLLAAGCGGGVKEMSSSSPPVPPVAQGNPLDAVRPPKLPYSRPITPYVGDALGDLPAQVKSLSLKDLVQDAANAHDRVFDHPRSARQVLADPQLIATEAADALVCETILDRDDGTLDEVTHDQIRDDLFDRYAELAFPDSLFAGAERQLDAAQAEGLPAKDVAARRDELGRLKALAGYARAGLYALGNESLDDKPRSHVLVRLGEDYRAQGDLPRAVAALHMALDLSDSPDTRMQLAEALYASGDDKGGDEMLARPLPADASVRAKALREMAKARKEERSLAQAEDVASVVRRIELLADLGDTGAAVQAADDLARRAPGEPASWGAVALAAWLDGHNPDEALQACARGAKVLPHARTWLAVEILGDIGELRRQPPMPIALPGGGPASQPAAVAAISEDLSRTSRELGSLGGSGAAAAWPALGALEALLAHGAPHVATAAGDAVLAQVKAVPRSEPANDGLDMVQLYLELAGRSYRDAERDFDAAMPRLEKAVAPTDRARLDGLLVEAALEVAVRDRSAAAQASAAKHAAKVAADGAATWAAFYRAQVSTAAWVEAPRGNRAKQAQAALQDLANAAQSIATDGNLPDPEKLSLLYPTMVNLMVLGTIEGQKVAGEAAKLLQETPLAQYPEALLAEGFAALHGGDKDTARQLFGLASHTTPAVAVRAHRWLAEIASAAGDAAGAAKERAAAAAVAEAMGPAAPYLWMDAYPSTTADAAFVTDLETDYDLGASDDLPASQLSVSSSLLLVPDPDLSDAGAPASAPAVAKKGSAKHAQGKGREGTKGRKGK